MLDYPSFESLAKSYRTIPVYRKVLADLLTPISAFMHLSKEVPNAYLLESVENGTRYARYSFMGYDPKLIIRHEKGINTVTKNGKKKIIEGSFIKILKNLKAPYQAPQFPDLPSFTGGFVGYMGYDTIKWIEKIPTHKNQWIEIPEALFMLFEEMLIFDHLKNELIFITHVGIKKGLNLKNAFEKAQKRIDKIEASLNTSINYHSDSIGSKKTKSVTTNINGKTFKSNVLKAKEHIQKGNIFQVVLSQRFEKEISVSSFDIYRSLRLINPSPYMFYLKFEDFEIVGASPELMVKVENGCMEACPIAGTRKRGKTPEEDINIGKELIEDEKERAEHLMLVDLARNEIGKVCEYGSVKLKEFMSIHYYSHVIHIVSSIQGKLKKGVDVLDALFAAFPPGTLTGAPKIRAMEIISDLESDRRNIYGGALGYLDFSGNMDTCIIIRTMLIKNGKAYIQAGAGVVQDSDPKKELEEIENKAAALIAAIDHAQRELT